MNRFAAFLSSLALAALLSACAGSALRWTPEHHVVQPGETLYSIAWDYGLDYRTVARWNNLGDGTLIRPGQKLKLTGSASSQSSAPTSASTRTSRPPPPPDDPAPKWQWPTAGRIGEHFGGSPMTESGIRIDGRPGQAVVAAAPGEVVYAGSGLIGYGQLLIIKHNASYLSAYGHNSELLVKEGEQLKSGQPVARMGKTSSGEVALHFEIRRNGKPVDPLKFLPPR